MKKVGSSQIKLGKNWSYWRLEIAFAFQRVYMWGNQSAVETDHKLFKCSLRKDAHALNPRLQWMRLKRVKFDFEISLFVQKQRDCKRLFFAQWHWR